MITSIQISTGSAAALGLAGYRISTLPTTAYFFLMGEGCRGKCLFCPQSSKLDARANTVSRVEWPTYDVSSVLNGLSKSGGIKRACIQCSDEPKIAVRAVELVRGLKGVRDIPISVSIPPIPIEDIESLKGGGVERITIPLDCSNERLIQTIKGKSMDDLLRSLSDAVDVFGRGKVGTHIIAGLGETEREVVMLIDGLFTMGILPSLFAFFPVIGTALGGRAPPSIESYRRLQIARFLVVERGLHSESFEFDQLGNIAKIHVPSEEIKEIVQRGEAFMVAGCPGCNRPYFNERVRGPIYNYPRPLEDADVMRVEGEINGSFACSGV
ncbi:MAG: radical SAM protein [Candidatus Methanomethylicia archaeon]|nr:radical SAM protein [Candidatus Methanomethylicia archaeon]